MTKSLASLLSVEKPLQIAGAVNAMCALLAKQAGFLAIYLSGAGVANVSYGLPDLGLTTLDNVLEDARRICDVVDLPLLVDIDTGWGGSLMVGRTIKQMILAGVSAVHLEDQVITKRCGHRPNKTLISTEEMVDKIKAAADAKSDPHFTIMARTDASGDEALERMLRYRDAGADMLFPEAVTTLPEYKHIKEQVGIPILANITEFGKTPYFTVEELKTAGVDIVLYPLSAARAMHKAAETIYHGIRKQGTQKPWIGEMQTRDELYRLLDYEQQEERINQWNQTKG